MPFTLAKVLALLAQPTTIAMIVTGLGILLLQRGKRVRLGARLAWGGFFYLVIAGLTPFGNMLIFPLEERFPVPRIEDGERVAGIIILGGFEDGLVSAERKGLAVNESAERLTEGLRLALRHPEAKVVFTGGVGAIWSREIEATGPVSQFLIDCGIARERIVLEGRSRNTYENAIFTRDLVSPKPGERWFLVTSAYHMPRSMGIFRKAGFDVTAYPVDYRTSGPQDMARFFERISAGLLRTDTAANEWMGLVAYRALGRIGELFPGP
ncbi:MAG: YdcF family protein [Hyphomicrobium sp.]|jgi:uncharacterized SAM-binding protein YcdF (DUF218 family)